MSSSGESASADYSAPKGSHSHAIDVLVFILAAFIVLPLTLGFALLRRAAWTAWAAVAAFMILAQAVSDEVQAFTVLVVVLAILGSPFVTLGLWLRRGRPDRR
jgi:hypothetical protein